MPLWPPLVGSGSGLAYYTSPRARAMADGVSLTAPTFTDGTAGSSAPVVAGAVIVPAVTAGVINTNPYRYEGADMVVYGTNYVLPNGQSNTSGVRAVQSDWKYQVAFDLYSATGSFEIYTTSVFVAGSFRVWDNERVSAYRATPASGAARLIKVDLAGGAGYHRIVIEVDRLFPFGGIAVPRADSVMPPSLRSGPKLGVVGDSYSVGGGISAGGSAVPSVQGWPEQMVKCLGITNYRVYGIGGTGIVTEPGATTPNYPHRINDVLGYAPDICLVQGTINDLGLAGGALQTATATYLAALRAGLPAASKLVMIGMPWVKAAGANHISANNEMKAAALAASVPFIDPVAEAWFTGTGQVGVLTGDGNADVYNSSVVAGHPSLAGHDYLGRQVARALTATLKIGQ